MNPAHILTLISLATISTLFTFFQNETIDGQVSVGFLSKVGPILKTKAVPQHIYGGAVERGCFYLLLIHDLGTRWR
jgi:hypothetical protein